MIWFKAAPPVLLDFSFPRHVLKAKEKCMRYISLSSNSLVVILSRVLHPKLSCLSIEVPQEARGEVNIS